MSHTKKKLGIFVDWYLPAYKAGGPIQSVANLVGRLKKDLDISVITSNSDLNETLDIPDNRLNTWVDMDGYRVMYIDAKHQNYKFIEATVNIASFDVVYFNSLFSLKFMMMPLWILRNQPVRKVLATRGMLAKGALALKPLKKKMFLNLFKWSGLHKKLVWHATSQTEYEEIKTHFGHNRNVILAPNLSSLTKSTPYSKEKNPNELRLFFLSRIAIKKNLLGALNSLSKVHSDYKINFTIIGPIDETAYWDKCSARIDALPGHIEVNYLGAIPNQQISSHLKEEHVLLLPTYGENFGHVIMESWQSGCPVIISDQTPWRDLKRQKLGFDLPLSNEQSFTEAIEFFCKMSGQDYSQWSLASHGFSKTFVEDPSTLEKNKNLFALQ